jgi:hypothetical protein
VDQSRMPQEELINKDLERFAFKRAYSRSVETSHGHRLV